MLDGDTEPGAKFVQEDAAGRDGRQRNKRGCERLREWKKRKSATRNERMGRM